MAETQNISSPTVNRIFIGGLGANVTTNDLKNIFNSLGKVSKVEFVRTNGRDFAYADFKPESDKSLQKLFSIYNGCKWKGGKLRLEKAKEHYLTKLKREWEQESEPKPEPNNPESGKEKAGSETGKLNPEFDKIGIFFPKLKKVKSLPYKGSGKHKYSFQRVELSSTLPLHFCDCEEHFEEEINVMNDKYSLALESAAREKEISIMDSVLGRLMSKEREERENVVEESKEIVMEEREERVVEESEEREEIEEIEEEEEEDDGDMVMNISDNRYKTEEFMLESLLKESLENKKKSEEKKSEVSKEKIIENEEREIVEEVKDKEEMKEEEESDGDIVMNLSSNKSDEFMDHIMNETLDNKKELEEKGIEKEVQDIDKSIQNEEKEIEKEEQVEKEEELDGDIFMNISSNKSDELMLDHVVKETLDNKKELQEEINELLEDKNVQTQEQAKESSLNVEQMEEKEKSSPIKKESETKIQKPNSNTWFQKCAWRDLVGDSRTNLFSSSSSTNPKPVSTHQTLISNPPKQANRLNKSQITRQKPSSIVPKEIKNSNEESKKRKEISKDGESVNKDVRRVVKKVTVGEVCSFMRNEESEKEWNKTKKALSGFMKSNKSEESNKMRGKRGE